MDYKQLEYFLSIALEGSFSKSARKLFVTQQALSKAIDNLEEELNVRLFTRTSNGVELTKYGKELHGYAMEYVNSHEQIIKHMKDFKDRDNKHLSIGYATGMLQQFPRKFIPNFIAEHADTDIALYSYHDDSYNRSLRNFDIDIVLCSMFPTAPYKILYEFHHKAFLLIGKNHPLAKKKIIHKADLINQKILSLNTENDLKRESDQTTNEWRLDAQIIISASEYDLIYDLLKTGNYISFYATHYPNPDHDLVARKVEGLDIIYDFYVMAREGIEITPAIEDFINQIRCFLEKPIDIQ